jgi:hypothetical protein
MLSCGLIGTVFIIGMKMMIIMSLFLVYRLELWNININGKRKEKMHFLLPSEIMQKYLY